MNVSFNPRFNCFVYSGDVEEVATSCPEAKRINGHVVVIPNDHELLQKLAKRGIPIPMPMADYDWPIRPPFQPFKVQRQMANFLVANPACFNLSEMRTGKTLAALWAADYIMKKEGGKTLIVAQLSTLKRTWGDAILENFMGRRSYTILYGSAERRSRALATNSDFYIINYEGLNIGSTKRAHKVELAGFCKELNERSDIRIAIVDEASAYRDPASLRHKIGRQLLIPRKYLWLLTGTPTPTSPENAYGLAKLVNNVHGETLTSFRRRTLMQVTKFKWVPRTEAKQIVADTLTPAIRFKQSDCFDAPKVVIIKRDCEMSSEQGKLWREMKRELTLTLKGKDVNAVNEAALRSKLIQIACGAVYDADHKAHYLDAAPRFKVLDEILEEAPRKVLVFAPLTSVINAISSRLTRQAREHVMIDGSVTGEERDNRLRAFMGDGGPLVCVAHPGPIARGLDFTSAATVVWFGATDNTEDYIQANERINGPRQKHLMTIVQIAATAVEREIYARLEANKSLQGSILKLLEEDSAS